MILAAEKTLTFPTEMGQSQVSESIAAHWHGKTGEVACDRYINTGMIKIEA